MERVQVAIVGAGPYGLAAAAHLRSRGIDTLVFGRVMQFWKEMPKGMLLRSEWDGSHLSDPKRAYTLDAYEAWLGSSLPDRIPMSEYARYGEWFQSRAVPDVDLRFVTRVARDGDGFVLAVDESEQVSARRVIVATGLAAFTRRPEIFAGLPASAVTHACDERDFGIYNGQRVLVVGAGQSALECAALLNEAGASVEVVVRQGQLHWLAQTGHISRESGRLAHLLYPPGAVGPLGINWVVQLPALYRALPAVAQRRVFARALRPAGSGWVKPRMQGVTITTDRGVRSAGMSGDTVRVTLTDGSEREIDHILLGTGYEVDVDRYAFLSDEIKRDVKRIGRQPEVARGFESSVRGLHFIGASSDLSFGPLMRFVAGTNYAARAVAAKVKADHVPGFALPVTRERLASDTGD